jgi:prolyl-tRNA editing enzyme YbaK/EbsC (Cys-tRNA(Pro) deacylase)
LLKKNQTDPICRVRSFLSEHGIQANIRELKPESTRTSLLASQALGCTVAQIAKTIAFVYFENADPRPIMVILSGDKSVSIDKLASYLSVSPELLRKMSADEVKQFTGYSIGGVPPFPHNERVKISVDKSLFRFKTVWAAAGKSNAVMELDSSIFDRLEIPKIFVSSHNS